MAIKQSSDPRDENVSYIVDSPEGPRPLFDTEALRESVVANLAKLAKMSVVPPGIADPQDSAQLRWAVS
jgi:hypothetical protein